MGKITKKGLEWVLTFGTLTGAAQALQHKQLMSCNTPAARPRAEQSAFGKGREKRGGTAQGQYSGNTGVTAISKGHNMGNMSFHKRLQGR